MQPNGNLGALAQDLVLDVGVEAAFYSHDSIADRCGRKAGYGHTSPSH